MIRSAATSFSVGLILVFSLFTSRDAYSHGGVALTEDLCVITIDFMEAHFTVFQPETRQNDEFCEDIPDVTGSVFVMEYYHELLFEMPIDFRIVRDVNNVGRFADWDDIVAIDDLEAATVYYQPPIIESSGFYIANHNFDEAGTYIGVVTAEHPDDGRNFNAVFYFQVGGRDWGTIPIFLLLVILAQAGYWYTSGGYEKYKAKKKQAGIQA